MGTETIARRHAVRALVARAEQGAAASSASAESADARPLPDWESMDDVAEHFVDDADVLLELHHQWVRTLSARLHHGQVVARRTALSVRDLYDELCREHAAVRRILDAHVAHPALWEPTAREHALLARIAGLVGDDADGELAATTGRRLLSQRVPVQRAALAPAPVLQDS